MMYACMFGCWLFCVLVDLTSTFLQCHLDIMHNARYDWTRVNMISDRPFFLLQKTFTERFPIVTSRARPRYCASLQPARPGLDRHPRVPCVCVVVIGNVVVFDFFQSGSFAPFRGQVVRFAFPQAGHVWGIMEACRLFFSRANQFLREISETVKKNVPPIRGARYRKMQTNTTRNISEN